MQEPRFAFNAENRIIDLCSHNGGLYCVISRPAHFLDIGGGKIYEVLIDRETIFGREIASRKGMLYALCSHNGKLYDAASCTVRETLTDKVVATRKDLVQGLCSYKGKLYDGGIKKIYETSSNNKLKTKLGFVRVLCPHNGKLYYVLIMEYYTIAVIERFMIHSQTGKF